MKLSVLLFVTALSTLFLCVSNASPPHGPEAITTGVSVDRGKYLVNIVGCNDCHTPLTMGPNGPHPDLTRFLSGHPEGLTMPPAPKLASPWMSAASATNTAWAGPWGVSFTANLTPDPETGLGRWNEQIFVSTIRTGRHMGKGRPILPPMPVGAFANMTDDDLKSIFAYLKTIPAIKNRVPEPLAPN